MNDTVQTVEPAPSADAEPRPGRGPLRRDWALLTFIALALVAAGYYLYIGRHNWFFFDEWDFLADRTAGSLHDLLAPHTDEHWSTVPILVYRLLFNIFGLRTYLPYMSLSIGLHIAIAALMLVVMRRARVHPWWATIVASAYLFFGKAAFDIIWAFQINFELAMAFGLVQLLLAATDPGDALDRLPAAARASIDRRDAFGLLAGLLALMSSAPAVVMVIAVGIATLVRRGWRLALFHTAPLAVVYVAWRSHYAHSTLSPSVGAVWRFVRIGMRSTFESVGGTAVAGILLAAVLGVGWFLVFRAEGPRARVRLAGTIGLLCAAPMVFVITSLARATVFFAASGPDTARYIDIAAVLSLPALAVACDALTRRWRFAAPLALLFVVGLHANLDAASSFAASERSGSFLVREMVSGITTDPLIRHVPRDLQPDPNDAPEATVGWLLGAESAGRLPDPWHDDAITEASNHLRLLLDERVGRLPEPTRCVPLRANLSVRLATGDRFQVSRSTLYAVQAFPPVTAHPVLLGPTFRTAWPDHIVTVLKGPLWLRLVPVRGGVLNMPTVCLPATPGGA